MGKVSVLVADDEEAVRDTLQDVMRSDPSIDLVGAASNAPDAIDIARREHPDVALVDVRMPGGGGPRAAREITRLSPPSKVIAFSAHEDAEAIAAMVDAGAAGYLVKGTPADEILGAIRRSAEEATSEARPRRGGAKTYAEFVSAQAREARIWQTRRDRIRHLLADRCLRIEYQPIFELSGGAMVGMEALARFDFAPAMAPAAWFSEAAEVGLLEEMELAAIEAALQGLPRIPHGIYLSLNVSPALAASPQLKESLGNAPPERLVLELTEHAPVDDYQALGEVLAPLRAGEARVAIDDVGSGFASLRHVLCLDPELIKLDMTMTRGIDREEGRLALVAALVTYAARVGAGVVAEGVETRAELRALHDAGVQFAQGFLLARPGPLSTRAR
jgi:EAL domain-containing protein (putative c-di-GMP-specific phosphodiesterase class I)/ActR/RegA family two-component response regulator